MSHRDTMVALVRSRGWTDGVELGIGHGHLFERLLTECPALRRLTGVDLGRRPERRARAQSVAARFPTRARLLWCATDVAADHVPNGSVDFVFIDAGHSYRDVSSDIAHWRAKVRLGGWFGGHDYDPKFAGVIHAVEDAFGGRVGHLPDTIWFVREEQEPVVRALTLVVPYYENPLMLAEQQRLWSAYPPALRAALHVIVVDDGSPRWPAQTIGAPRAALASYRLYRIGVDVRWNWLACRNLGVAEAATEWVLLTDIDHVAPPDTLHAILHAPLDPATVYRFSRVTAPAHTPYKPHPNSWLLTRALFDRLGGYDERFSGYYGSDSEVRARVTRTARAVELLPQVLIRYPRELVPDASTTTYGRKEPQDRRLRKIRQARDLVPGWQPLRGTFPWTRVI